MSKENWQVKNTQPHALLKLHDASGYLASTQVYQIEIQYLFACSNL